MEKNYQKVSIVVPTYNRADYLEECIESIANQNYQNLEIIVSDDNSKDNTFDVVKKLQKKYPFIKYVKNNKYPQGPHGNKNNGLDYVTGDVIGIFDDDDVMLDGAIQLMQQKIEDGYDIVVANCKRSDNGKFSGIGFDRSEEVEWKYYLCSKMKGEFWWIFKKDILENRRFDTDIYARESTLWNGLWINRKVFYIHKAVRLYRIHSNNISNANFEDYNKLTKTYEREIEYYGDYMKKFCPCQLSFIYSLAGYFAKLSGNLKKSFIYSFKSIKNCPSNKKAYFVLALNFLPNKVVSILMNFRKKLK